MTTFVSVEKLGMSSSPALASISYMLVVVPDGSTVVISATISVEPSSSKLSALDDVDDVVVVVEVVVDDVVVVVSNFDVDLELSSYSYA